MPLLLCEFHQANPSLDVRLSVYDTQTVVSLVAERELELGIVGAARRRRAVEFEPFFSDEVILVCPPGHPSAGRTITVDELAELPLVLMQEGAGVRQLLEDELRRQGRRLRDLNVELVLGLQESVRSAVQAGYGATFISRRAVEADLASGTARRDPRRRARPAAPDLDRACSRASAEPRGRGVRGVRPREARPMIVRWGLDELEPLLAELSIERPFLVASPRWDESGLPAAGRWSEIPSHRIAVPADVDGILAAGGGSAIDTAKAASAASGLQLVSVPTTYSGAEWTDFFGVRDPGKRMVGGGSGAHLAGIVYEPKLTLDLPRPASGGTAMNALAHCVEALYPGDLESARRGAALIVEWLPRVLEDLSDLEARTHLLEGAAAAGEALAAHGLYLGHAMAQAIGGAYGLPHGALNAICLPAAMRFNADVAPLALAVCPVETAEDLARLAGFTRLRDLGVPEDDLPALAAATAARPGARANPRPASAAEIEELLRSVW